VSSPFPQTGPSPPGRSRSGPGRAGYVIGALLLVAAAIGAAAVIALGVKSTVDRVGNYQRVSVTNGGEIDLAQPGRYYAYYERPGIKERSEIPFGLRIELVGPAGERQVLESDIGRTGTNEQYSFNGHDGVRFTGFQANRAGRYRVRVLGEPVGTPSASIAFGKGALSGLLGGAAVGVLGGGLLGLIGFILLIVTAVRRSRHRRRMAAANFGYGGAPGYGGPSFGSGPGYGPPAGPPGWAPPQGAPPPAGPPPTGWPPPAGPPPPPGHDPGRSR